MVLDFTKRMIELNKASIKQFGEKNGEKLFKSLMNNLLFVGRTKQILQELDLFKNIYVDSIFSLTRDFYELNFKKEQTEAEKELMKEVHKIIGEPNHNFSDEITLLFYVGLYHKIENYENEILQCYNTLNETNYKELKSIGIDIPNKKKLFEDRDRLRLISNSIKHNNYYPKKELIKFYPYLKVDQKISLVDFKPIEDIELTKAYINYFNLLIILKNFTSKYEKLKSILGEENSVEFEKYFDDLIRDESYKDENDKSTCLVK
jgi:hypothetical protein